MPLNVITSVTHRIQLFVTPWTAAPQTSLSTTNSWSLLKLMSIEIVIPSISSSVVPFSSGLQSFPASGSFPMSQFFPSGGQSIRASAWASVLPMNIQDWFPLGLTGLIVRKHLTRGFLCAVLDLSGTLWPLLIPEYSGIKRRGTPFPGAEESKHW